MVQVAAWLLACVCDVVCFECGMWHVEMELCNHKARDAATSSKAAATETATAKAQQRTGADRHRLRFLHNIATENC